jgi:hypothetical protein
MNRFAIVALCALLALSSGTISAAIAQTAAPPSPVIKSDTVPLTG